MQLNFLTPHVQRMRPDGTFETLHEGGFIGRLRSPVVLLARSLCTFHLFEGRAVPVQRRRQAARLQARVASPYLVAGVALVKAGEDFGIWWWDIERVQPLIQARFGTRQVLVRPETLAQPRSNDWRIVKLGEGYETQRWRSGQLVASAWRARRLDAATWAAFTRLQRGDVTASETPPPAESLPIAFDTEAFSVLRMEISRDQAAAAAAGALAVAALTLAAFWTAQALRLESDAKAITLETAAMRRSLPVASGSRNVEGERRKLTAYRELEERTNPLTAAGAAIGVLALQSLSPSQLNVEEDVLSLTLPYEAGRRSDNLVEEFELSGYFHDVRPRSDAATQTFQLEMKIRDAAPPLTAIE